MSSSDKFSGNVSGSALGSSPASFSGMDLAPAIQRAIEETGYKTPTPIQSQAIPLVNEGHDLLGIAQTGTGKTAAFCLPILNILQRHKTPYTPRAPRVLILTPTRELAIQIHKSCLEYGKHLHQKYAVIFGGVGQMSQVRDLSRGVDILVATPGRLLDLVNQNHLRLSGLEIFVLDEADRMLDMGFMRDVKKIVAILPAKRQNLFFSATMPPEIQNLAHSILRHPKKVEVTPPATTVEKIHQEVFFVDKENKINLLVHVLKDQHLKKVLVFASMKHLANKISDKLSAQGISSAAIHGNKSQGARQRALEDFVRGRVLVLVATDIASRGIDVDGITHVINFDLPNVPEDYVHRIGRTARAGASGKAISFCTAEEKSYLAAIEKTIKRQVEVVTTQPFHSENAQAARLMSVGRAKALIEEQRERHPGGLRGGGRGPQRSTQHGAPGAQGYGRAIAHGHARGHGSRRSDERSDERSAGRSGDHRHGLRPAQRTTHEGGHHRHASGGPQREVNGNTAAGHRQQHTQRHDDGHGHGQRHGHGPNRAKEAPRSPSASSHRPAHSPRQNHGHHRPAHSAKPEPGNSAAPSAEPKKAPEKRRRWFGRGTKSGR